MSELRGIVSVHDKGKEVENRALRDIAKQVWIEEKLRYFYT